MLEIKMYDSPLPRCPERISTEMLPVYNLQLDQLSSGLKAASLPAQ